MNEGKYKKQPVSVRLDKDISEWIRNKAKSDYRSVSAEINNALRKQKEEEDKQKAA